VDTGFLDASLLVESQEEYGVDLLGPMRADYHWQAHEAKGFAAGDFAIEWRLEQATCPAANKSISWSEAIDNRKNGVVKIKFSSKDCRVEVRRLQHQVQRQEAMRLLIVNFVFLIRIRYRSKIRLKQADQ
jgi:hypothetical protein